MGRGNSEKRILLVDDDPHILDFISDLLEADGYQCQRCSSGHSVVEVVRAEGVRLVILDLLMPGMDGWQVLEELAESKLIEKVPVVIVSAVPTETSRQRALDLGAHGYVAKPFSVAELQEAVRGALGVDRTRGAR